MAPIVTAYAIDSSSTKLDPASLAARSTSQSNDVSAFVLYIFRVPGSQDFCLSTFKPHKNDIVTALDVLLAAYYIRVVNEDVLQILRGDHCVASLRGQDIEVKLKIDDPASTNNDSSISRKPIDNAQGNYFKTAVNTIDKKTGHSKAMSSESGSFSRQSPVEGLNFAALAEAVAAAEATDRQNVLSAQVIKEKLRTAKRSMATSDFRTPWSDRCIFYSSVTGQDLKCDQMLGRTTDNSTTSLPVSELRFNLPVMLGRPVKKKQMSRSENDVQDLSPPRKHLPASLQRFGRHRSATTTDSPELYMQAAPLRAPMHSRFPFEAELAVTNGCSQPCSPVEDDETAKPSLPARPMSMSVLTITPPPEPPTRPLEEVPPLPPRHQSRSESNAVNGKSHTIRRKAVNSSEASSSSLSRPHPNPACHRSAYSVPHLQANLPYLQPDPPPPAYTTQPPSPTRQHPPSVLDPDPTQRSNSPSRQTPRSPTSPMSPAMLPPSPGRLDLTLGQEALGGGFRGQQAKLGKLLIFPDGYRMLDLVVATNMVMFWRAWRGGKGVLRDVNGGV